MTVTDGLFDSDERDDFEDSSDDSHEREYDDEYEDDELEDDDDSGDDSDDDTPDIESLKKELASMRQRFSGATRKINEVLRDREMSKAEHIHERNQLLMALMQERVKDLEPEEQRAKMQQFEYALNQQSQLQLQQEQSQQKDQVFGLLAKRMAVQHIANQYGVPEEELMRFNDAEDMKAHAESISELMKANTGQTSKKRNQPRQQSSRESTGRRRRRQSFDTPAPVAQRRKKIETVDDAEAELKRLVKNARRSTV